MVDLEPNEREEKVWIMFLIAEMFVKVRNVLQFRAPLIVTPLRCGSQQAAVKSSSQASPLGKWDILAAVCIGNIAITRKQCRPQVID